MIDPTKLILNLVGTVDVTNNEAITGWVAQQLLKVTRTAVTTQLMSGAWPILGLSMHSPDIERATMPAANEQLAGYGLAIARFGNLDVNLDGDHPDPVGAGVTVRAFEGAGAHRGSHHNRRAWPIRGGV